MESDRPSRSRLPRGETSTSTAKEDLPICRQFWNAGDYQTVATGRAKRDGFSVHPKFLHTNATSHKWALGALAELLDNAMDEVQNGATYVKVDKIINPRDNSPALLVCDDGGGMTPNSMHECMSLGFSRRTHTNKIGRYGNGFKTSTMRLGADVIVFSSSTRGSIVTQTIGMLSFTFLRKGMGEKVVAPIIDYEVSRESLEKGKGKGCEPRRKFRRTPNSSKYLESIMEWSPYVSERELLEQFEDIGMHGTKIIVYNLWFNDANVLELDFDTDKHDIQLSRELSKDESEAKYKSVKQQEALDQHISNRYQSSLRAYSSILYLKMPPKFQIILRGEPVEHYNLVSDLRFPQTSMYTPQSGTNKSSSGRKKYGKLAIRVGFTKEARQINVHGFNVYHKNRLIIPFWKVFQENSSRGRGVMGVLEANFVEPAHDKQDFEKTGPFLGLKAKLQTLTKNYWNKNSHKIGYQSPTTKADKALERAEERAAATKANIVQKNLSGPSTTSASALRGSQRNATNADGPQVQSRSANVVRKNLGGSSTTSVSALRGSRPNAENADGPQVESRSANDVPKNLSGPSTSSACALPGSRPNAANAYGPQVKSRPANEASQVKMELTDVLHNSSERARSAEGGFQEGTELMSVPQNFSKRARSADRGSQGETDPIDVPQKSSKRAKSSDGATQVETEPTDVPQKLSERSRSSNRAFQVGIELINVPHNPSKESGSANTTSEAEYHAHMNPSPARDAVESALLRATALEYDEFIASLMRENKELKESTDAKRRDSKVLLLEEALRDAKEKNMKLSADVRASDSNVSELKKELRDAKMTNMNLLEEIKARDSKVLRLAEVLEGAEKMKSDLEEQVRELLICCSSKFNNEDCMSLAFRDRYG